ncbi:MAG: sec-independent protein translocase protein TatA [Blastocatellia bacterium]|jgi:TatA/E family protein of Tat protein translocase|nr:sec-independent protein translocase protein TatA [Blastocatellia bacterium]
MFLFILDSLGNSELLVILVAALIFFGPRKLPQLSRTVGKSLTEFRRASDDFKRTWAQEVALDVDDKKIMPAPTIATVDASVSGQTVQRGSASPAFAEDLPEDTAPDTRPTLGAPTGSSTSDANVDQSGDAVLQPTRKQDWL